MTQTTNQVSFSRDVLKFFANAGGWISCWIASILLTVLVLGLMYQIASYLGFNVDDDYPLFPSWIYGVLVLLTFVWGTLLYVGAKRHGAGTVAGGVIGTIILLIGFSYAVQNWVSEVKWFLSWFW